MSLIEIVRSFLPTDDALMSEAWLRSQQRMESRVEFHSVTWTWPINKVAGGLAEEETGAIPRLRTSGHRHN